MCIYIYKHTKDNTREMKNICLSKYLTNNQEKIFYKLANNNKKIPTKTYQF